MTPHFSDAELACKCGCGMLPKIDFMQKVENLRVTSGVSMNVTSGARCAKHNQEESHTGATGPHTTGRAIDIAIRGAQAWTLLLYALEAGFTGVGVSQKGESRFLHLDDLPNAEGQPRPTVWSY